MHHDMRIGLALGILLIGIVGAFFFRNEPAPDAPPPEEVIKLGTASNNALDDPLAEFERLAAGSSETTAAQPTPTAQSPRQNTPTQPQKTLVRRTEGHATESTPQVRDLAQAPQAAGLGGPQQAQRTPFSSEQKPFAGQTALPKRSLVPNPAVAEQVLTKKGYRAERVSVRPVGSGKVTNAPLEQRSQPTPYRRQRPAPRHNNAWEDVPGVGVVKQGPSPNSRSRTRRRSPVQPASPKASNVPAPSIQNQTRPKTAYIEHRVLPGETLCGLAHRFLGKSSRYREIFEANKDIMKDPDDLKVGMVIRIPVPSNYLNQQRGSQRNSKRKSSPKHSKRQNKYFQPVPAVPWQSPGKGPAAASFGAGRESVK